MNFYSVLWLKNTIKPIIHKDLELCDVTLSVFESKHYDTWAIADTDVDIDFIEELEQHVLNGTYKETSGVYDLLVASFCVMSVESSIIRKIDLIVSVVVDETSTDDEVRNHLCRQIATLCTNFESKSTVLS